MGHMAKKLDFSDAWNDATGLLKAHKEGVLAIAGVFLFLPQIAIGYFASGLDVEGVNDSSQVAQIYEAWFLANGLFLFLASVVSMIGSVSLYVIFLRGNQTIGQAISTGLKLFITYFLVAVLTAIAVAFGFVLLIVPGIYFAVKFSLAPAALAAEHITNPIAAMKRSWAATKGNSLRIFFLLLIVGIVGLIAVMAVSAVLGIPVSLLLPTEAALFVNNIISSLAGAIFSAIFIALYAAIYRQLAGSFTRRELEETF